MSTRTRRSARHRRRFVLAFVVTVGVLAAISVGAAAVSLTHGPRVTEVQVDPEAATRESGSRVIFTADQALAPIDASQVTVEPATEFTVDAAGRTVGVRFPTALDAGVDYTVHVAGVTGIGAGPDSDLETRFTTPAASMLTLVRDPDGPDQIVRHEIGSDDVTAVFAADAIDDFRATSAYLAVTTGGAEQMSLTVVDRASGETVEVGVPGDGTLTGLQVSARGQLYGYTFSDAELTAESGRANVLFTGSLRDAFATGETAEPVAVGGEEPSIDRWRFVPETSSLLLNDFSSNLTLLDTVDESATTFGQAGGIQGVARSTYTALIWRVEEGFTELDLSSGEEVPVDDVDLGGETILGHMIPLATGGTLRGYAEMVEGTPADSRIVAAADGSVTDVATVAAGDALQQVCASPSAQYAAVTVAPDIVRNAFDRGAQPLPRVVETRVHDIRTGELVVTVPGFASSWCEVGPW